MSVAQSLGLTSKRANRALAAFAAKHRIRETFAQQGKAQIKVSAPRAFTTGLDFPAFPWWYSGGGVCIGSVLVQHCVLSPCFPVLTYLTPCNANECYTPRIVSEGRSQPPLRLNIPHRSSADNLHADVEGACSLAG